MKLIKKWSRRGIVSMGFLAFGLWLGVAHRHLRVKAHLLQTKSPAGPIWHSFIREMTSRRKS